MVAAGGKRIVAIAAVGGRADLEACTPCGGCRQRIAEFADTATRIILLDARSQPRRHTIDELLPASFRLR
jgi:cytidine deaminase